MKAAIVMAAHTSSRNNAHTKARDERAHAHDSFHDADATHASAKNAASTVRIPKLRATREFL